MHSRLAARQPNDVVTRKVSVLAGPLKRRLAELICIVHPTCVQPVVFIQPVVQPAVKCKHRVRVIDYVDTNSIKLFTERVLYFC